MSWQSVKDSFSIHDIGAPLLANLAKGIYTPEAVLREYVQNAGDSYLDLEDVQKGQVSVAEINAPNVSIDFYEQNEVDGTPDTSRPCTPAGVGCLAVVSFESTYRPLTPIIGNILFKNGVTFKATSILAVEYTCPNGTHTAVQCPKQP